MSTPDEINSNIDKLDGCKTKADALSVAIETNIKIINYNQNQDQKAASAIQVWQERGRFRVEEQENWTEVLKTNYDISGTDIRPTIKKGDTSYPWWCQNDFGEDWKDYGVRNQGIKGEEQRNCVRTVTAREKIATNTTINKLGQQKPDFNETSPEKGKGEFSYEPISEIDPNIDCCPDLKDMTADSSSNEYLARTTKCISDIIYQKDDLIAQKSQRIDVSNTTNIVAKTGGAYTYNYIIILIIVLLCCCLLSSFAGAIFIKKSSS